MDAACSSNQDQRRAKDLKPTLHACARYAQIVLGLPVGDRDLMSDPKLYGRCARGIERMIERSQPSKELLPDGRALLVVGTRALVVHGGRVMTVMSAPNARGFGKRLLRDPDLVAAA